MFFCPAIREGGQYYLATPGNNGEIIKIGKGGKINGEALTDKELIAVLYGHDIAGTYGENDAWGFYTENNMDAANMMKFLTRDNNVYTDRGGPGTRHNGGYRHWHPTKDHALWSFPDGSGQQYKYFHGWYGDLPKRGRK